MMAVNLMGKQCEIKNQKLVVNQERNMRVVTNDVEYD